MLDEHVRGLINDYIKADFIVALPQIREMGIKEEYIISVWKKTGLYLYNPKIVLI